MAILLNLVKLSYLRRHCDAVLSVNRYLVVLAMRYNLNCQRVAMVVQLNCCHDGGSETGMAISIVNEKVSDVLVPDGTEIRSKRSRSNNMSR